MNHQNLIFYFCLFFCSLFFNSLTLQAQEDYDVYWVQFTTKKGTPYSLFHPQEYLSSRALARRAKFGIRIDSLDLPIHPRFLQTIKEAGFKFHMKSRWMNGVAVIGKKEDITEALGNLDFVASIEAIGYTRPGGPGTTYIGRRDYDNNYPKHSDYYGDARNQIKMMNGHCLHALGLRGEGVHVGVFDGGWVDMRETPVFDSLYQKNQLIYTHDYVQDDDYVYEGSSHGRDVLSCMAANMPYLFVGTAPDASYHLCKTEDSQGEYRIEEYNWLAAMEYADSVGIDVVNSSLGYFDFDDDAMDYAYRHMDGNTTVITRTADIAASRGIMVVTSAGNEGDSKWKHISVPGDADSVLTVGAVNRDKYHAKFSSYGLDEHYMVKPNVMARGHMAIVAATERYGTRYQMGTSFSSPIMAGIVASLYEGLPYVTNVEMIRALEKYGHKADDPDTQLGYGVPDVFELYKEFSKGAVVEIEKKKDCYYHPVNTQARRLDFVETETEIGTVELVIFDATGKIMHQSKYERGYEEVWRIGIEDYENYPTGIYIAYLKYGKSTKRILLAK